MKILYISHFKSPDYQNDMIFHGLKSLFGKDVYESNYAWYMYKKVKDEEKSMNFDTIYFTVYNKLDRGLSNVVDDIKTQIKNRFFDKIIYGSISRCNDHFEDVIKYYNKNEVIFIDGEDNTNILSEYLKYGKYFKRELTKPINNVFPVNFCIPKELIVDKVYPKENDYGSIIPGDKSTYTFFEEDKYYDDYKKAYFGLTIKKSGWDCLRHYEILMNGCIPYFPELENCPKTTMTKFPKDIILETNKLIDIKTLDLSKYTDICTQLIEYTRNNLTTEKEASYVIST